MYTKCINISTHYHFSSVVCVCVCVCSVCECVSVCVCGCGCDTVRFSSVHWYITACSQQSSGVKHTVSTTYICSVLKVPRVITPTAKHYMHGCSSVICHYVPLGHTRPREICLVQCSTDLCAQLCPLLLQVFFCALSPLCVVADN